jgi:short subunit dehydrogenase-like uncharacterized protein
MMSARNPNRGRRVAVCGASGHTGRFVVAELLRRGLTPIAIGRDEARLAEAGFQDRGVEARIANVEDPASLDRALAGAAAVINCAGPLLDTAESLAAAAVRARVHYLDVTAEQASALATFERFAAPNTPPPLPADETGRSPQVFLVDVIARNGTRVRRAIARGRDIYALTAPLVAEAAQRVLDGEVEGRGVLAPGQMFDAPNFLRSLAPEHLTFEISADDSVETWLRAYLGPRA